MLNTLREFLSNKNNKILSKMNWRIQTYINQTKEDANVFLSLVLSIASQYDNVQIIAKNDSFLLY